MSPNTAAVSPSASRSRRVHQELLKLIVLMLAVGAAFVGTRVFAAHRRLSNADDAATWFARGQEDAARGETAAAIDAFRRALAKAKDSREYSLALARALERSGSDDAAERALLRLRESAPEDSDVNLELARIAARRSDSTNAVRYYRNALYAPAAATDAEMRRGVRLELIRFLLSRGDRGRALSELLAAANDAADDPSAAVTLGGLFASAGDYRRAEDQFVSALRVDPHNAAAMAGAGTAAFNRGDYADATRYLAAVPDEDPETATMRDVADHVLSDDPLAARIGSSERRRRLMAALMAVSSRVNACLATGGGNETVTAAAREVADFSERIPQRGPVDTDTLDDALSIVFKAEQAAQAACGDGASIDRALVLIARLHGADAA